MAEALAMDEVGNQERHGAAADALATAWHRDSAMVCRGRRLAVLSTLRFSTAIAQSEARGLAGPVSLSSFGRRASGRAPWRRLAGIVLARHGCWGASTSWIPRRTRDSIVGAGTPLWTAGGGAWGRGLPITGTAVRSAGVEPDSAGEGWAGRDHGCWPLMDGVDDLGVVDPAQIRRGDP